MLYILRMSEHLPDIVSTAAVAEMLDVSQEAVSQLVRKGRLPAIRIGRNWAVRREDLIKFAETYTKGPGPRKSTT